MTQIRSRRRGTKTNRGVSHEMLRTLIARDLFSTERLFVLRCELCRLHRTILPDPYPTRNQATERDARACRTKLLQLLSQGLATRSAWLYSRKGDCLLKEHPAPPPDLPQAQVLRKDMPKEPHTRGIEAARSCSWGMRHVLARARSSTRRFCKTLAERIWESGLNRKLLP